MIRARFLAMGLVGTMSLLAGPESLYSVWAQQPPVKKGESAPAAQSGEVGPRVMEPEPETEPEVDKSSREPRLLPRLLGRKVLTPEQLEEAEHLKKLAAKFGTDPTAIVGRVQLSSQYADLTQGAKLVSTVARVDLPFRGNWLLRLDAPFLRWNDPNRSGTTSDRGTGDLSVSVGWRAYNTPEYAFFLGMASTFPTAGDNGLGSGKYTTGPLIATARFLPRLESFLFGIFQHVVSVGGDPSRKDIEVTRVTAQVTTIWADRWWTIAQGLWQVDWERNTQSSMTLEFEGGRSLIGLWGAYVRPGVGVWGREVPGAYEWNVEIGIRRMFGSF
jgi:hypothetical protein